jgi:SET and MYND domain-containing protein
VEYLGNSRQPLQLTVVAIRDVAEGEELCISYIDARIESVEKRADLLSNYGFVCECARCRNQRGSSS